MKSNKKAPTSTLQPALEEAQSALAAFEALNPPAWVPEMAERRGDAPPWQADAKRIESALEDLEHAALDALFPLHVGPLGADLVSDFGHYLPPGSESSPAKVAEVHRIALATYPGLAAVMQSRAFARRMQATKAGDTAIRGIARNLVDAGAGGDQLEAATVIAATVPQIHERLEQARLRIVAEAKARATADLVTWIRAQKARATSTIIVGVEHVDPDDAAARVEAGDESFADLCWHLWQHQHRPARRGAPGSPIFGR